MKLSLRIVLNYPRKNGKGNHKDIGLIADLEIPDKNLVVARKLRLLLPDKKPRHFVWLFIPLNNLYTDVRTGEDQNDSHIADRVELEHDMKFCSYEEGLRIHQALLSDGRFHGIYTVWAHPHKWTSDPKTWNGPNIISVSRFTHHDHDAVLLKDIGDLSVRAQNAFALAGIQTIGQLRTKSREELLKLRGFGKVPLRFTQKTLCSMGVDVNWY